MGDFLGSRSLTVWARALAEGRGTGVRASKVLGGEQGREKAGPYYGLDRSARQSAADLARTQAGTHARTHGERPARMEEVVMARFGGRVRTLREPDPVCGLHI